MNHADGRGSACTARASGSLRAVGVDLADVRFLFPITVVLSNLVSNVPAVMLASATRHSFRDEFKRS